MRVQLPIVNERISDVIFDTYCIFSLQRILLTQCTTTVSVVMPIDGEDPPPLSDVIAHEIEALSNRTYKSAGCIKRISQLSYLITVMGTSRVLKEVMLGTAKSVQYEMSLHQYWRPAQLHRSYTFY